MKASYQITVVNDTTQATPTNFQQLIQTTLQYPSGVRFWSPIDGWLYGWLESLSSTNQANIWVKIPSSIPANGVYQIYMVEDSSLNFDGVYWGEAPQLSSTYAQYDNGANLFPVYYNFAGTTLDSRISAISGVTLTQNNGLSVAVSITTTTFYILTTSSATSPFVMEAYETYYGVSTSTNGNEQWGLVIDSNTSTSQNTGGSPGGTNYLAIILNSSPSPQLAYGSTMLARGSSYYDFQYTAIDSFTQSTTGLIATFDGTSISASTTALTSGYIGLYIYSGVANSNIATVQWLRTRTYPPNGVMPETAIVPLQAWEVFVPPLP